MKLRMKINMSILNGQDIGGVGVFGRKATCALNVELKAAIINASVYIGHGVIVTLVTAA
jgi:hypothetical protein